MNELKIPTNLESNSIEAISLNEQANYRLMEIGEIKYQELLTSKLSKYLTGFDYADKILTVFLTVFSGTNILLMLKEKKITWIDHFCFFFIVLFKFWCC